jgi:hypothetical protein
MKNEKEKNFVLLIIRNEVAVQKWKVRDMAISFEDGTQISKHLHFLKLRTFLSNINMH